MSKGLTFFGTPIRCDYDDKTISKDVVGKKSCLNYAEIDNNFNVLEGRDICSVEVVDCELVIKLVNGTIYKRDISCGSGINTDETDHVIVNDIDYSRLFGEGGPCKESGSLGWLGEWDSDDIDENIEKKSKGYNLNEHNMYPSGTPIEKILRDILESGVYGELEIDCEKAAIRKIYDGEVVSLDVNELLTNYKIVVKWNGDDVDPTDIINGTDGYSVEVEIVDYPNGGVVNAGEYLFNIIVSRVVGGKVYTASCQNTITIEPIKITITTASKSAGYCGEFTELCGGIDDVSIEFDEEQDVIADKITEWSERILSMIDEESFKCLDCIGKISNPFNFVLDAEGNSEFLCNFDITYEFGELKVYECGNITLDCEDQSFVYDGTEHTFSEDDIHVSADGVTNYELKYSNDNENWYTYDVLPEQFKLTDVDTQRVYVKANGFDENNNEITGECSFDFSVTPAPLKIMVEDIEIDCCGLGDDLNNIEIECFCEGLVGGDEFNKGNVVYDEISTENIECGETIPVTIKNKSEIKGLYPNYEINFDDGTITINDKETIVFSGTYNVDEYDSIVIEEMSEPEGYKLKFTINSVTGSQTIKNFDDLESYDIYEMSDSGEQLVYQKYKGLEGINELPKCKDFEVNITITVNEIEDVVEYSPYINKKVSANVPGDPVWVPATTNVPANVPRTDDDDSSNKVYYFTDYVVNSSDGTYSGFKVSNNVNIDTDRNIRVYDNTLNEWYILNNSGNNAQIIQVDQNEVNDWGLDPDYKYYKIICEELVVIDQLTYSIKIQ